MVSIARVVAATFGERGITGNVGLPGDFLQLTGQRCVSFLAEFIQRIIIFRGFVALFDPVGKLIKHVFRIGTHTPHQSGSFS